MTLAVERIAADDPALSEMIAVHAAQSDAAYPAASNHHQDGATLAAEGAVMFVAREAGRVVGMGGYKIIAPGEAEVKSMHVAETARGRGVAARLLETILDDARSAGVRQVFLETGSLDASAAARRLYERAGFAYCPPFASYRADPLSVFMTRAL